MGTRKKCKQGFHVGPFLQLQVFKRDGTETSPVHCQNCGRRVRVARRTAPDYKQRASGERE